MLEFALSLVIGSLVVYIIGLRQGVKSNRVVIGGGASGDTIESGTGSLSWLFAIIVVAGILYFVSPPELRFGSFFESQQSKMSPVSGQIFSKDRPVSKELDSVTPPKSKDSSKKKKDDLADFDF